MLSAFVLLAGWSLSGMLTLWLAAGALGLAIVAVTFSLQGDAGEDLDRLHRTIDLVRSQLLEADRAGRPLDDGLRRELQALVARLPKDDLRRRRPPVGRRRLG